ncbi:MAG: mechanosensitive ion channel family protein [Deltaproteobacteria bacterium]|nr:mechanosensitive ion channel family protein [Deltaproteobacteria bacterium]
MNPAAFTPPEFPPFDGTIDTGEVVKNLVITVLLWAAALVARQVVLKSLRARGLPPADVRRWMSTTRNVMLVVLLAGTATVWFDELKTFAFSLVAFTAAIVIATKELIMGAGGTFLRTSSRSFEIGDRIEVAGLRGDVIDTSLFTTTLLEIGPGRIGHQQTGRAVTIPNAILLMQPVINETFSDAFVLHTFEVPIARDEHWGRTEAALLLACQEAQAPYSDDARAHFERRLTERGIETPTIEARVLVRVDSPSQVTLIARLPVPAKRKGRIEQAIVHRFLEWCAANLPTTTTTTKVPAPPPLVQPPPPQNTP